MFEQLAISLAILLTSSMSADQSSRPGTLDPIAESYVKLVLEVGQYDEGYVDFYSGPEEWRPAPLDSTQVSAFPYENLKAKADSLITQLDSCQGNKTDDLEKARWLFLYKQTTAVATRIDMLGGKSLSFDEESKALFDAVAPSMDTSDFMGVLLQLDSLLPGSGSIKERLDAYRKKFIIPPEKVGLVMQTALDSARSRTKAHMELPAGDSCSLEIVTNKPWRAFNAFKGHSRSVIQLNVDSPVRIGMALHYACHEGYPGHHVNASLWEEKLYRGREWVEFSISPLYAPSSLLAEGIAECAEGMAFPDDEALTFERQVLFPLAGLDTSEADRYWQIQNLLDSLGWVAIIVTRKYLDGELSAREVLRWAMDFGLFSPQAAEQLVPIAKTYRSYAVTYKLGKILVKNWLKANDASGSVRRRWQLFYDLESTPKVPSELRG